MSQAEARYTMTKQTTEHNTVQPTLHWTMVPQLIDKHFPSSNKLHKIFNRHNVQISYSCLSNMKSFNTIQAQSKLTQTKRQTIRRGATAGD